VRLDQWVLYQLWRRRRHWRIVALAVLAAGLFAMLSGHGGSPVRVVVVAGDSMEPTLSTGDAVLTVAQAAYKPGDVVAYRVPAGEPGAGTIVIHRIARTTPEGFLLQGDNNEGLDPWTPTAQEMVGKRVFTIPKLGLVVAFLRSALGLAVLAALVTFLVAIEDGEQRRSRRGRRRLSLPGLESLSRRWP
jgi:signal peptidase